MHCQTINQLDWQAFHPIFTRTPIWALRPILSDHWQRDVQYFFTKIIRHIHKHEVKSVLLIVDRFQIQASPNTKRPVCQLAKWQFHYETSCCYTQYICDFGVSWRPNPLIFILNLHHGWKWYRPLPVAHHVFQVVIILQTGRILTQQRDREKEGIRLLEKKERRVSSGMCLRKRGVIPKKLISPEELHHWCHHCGTHPSWLHDTENV